MSPSESENYVIQSMVEKGVGTVTLNKPDRLNALGSQDWLDLATEFRKISDREDVRVIILNGTGGGLSSGLDLKSLDFSSEKGLDITDEQVRGIFEPSRAIRSAAQPVIAVNDGAAIGAAVSLLAASDFRIGSPSSKYRTPFGNLGLVAGDLGLSWFLPRLVGHTKAAEILLGGEMFTGEQAFEWGLLTELVDDPLARAYELAGTLAQKSRFAMEGTKRLLNQALDAGRDFETHLEDEIATQTQALRSADFIEGVTAVLEKREPRFD